MRRMYKSSLLSERANEAATMLIRAFGSPEKPIRQIEELLRVIGRRPDGVSAQKAVRDWCKVKNLSYQPEWADEDLLLAMLEALKNHTLKEGKK